MKVLCYLPDSLAFQNKLGMLTRSAGVNFQPFENEAELGAFAEKESEKDFFLFIDSKHAPFLSEFSKKYSQCKIIIILSEPLTQQSQIFLDRDNIESFVATNNGEFEARELLMLLKKFQSKKILSLEKHLNFPSVVHQKKILTPQDKKTAINQLEAFIKKIGGSSLRTEQYSNRICELADELLLNAIFNANPRLKNASFTEPFQLKPEEVVKIKWGFDGEIFGLSVADKFGGLTRKAVLQYLQANQKKTPFAQRFEGGLGIRLIYERLHHYIVNVEPDKMTEIICLLRFDKKFKDFEKRLRSFHYFRGEE